MGSSTALNDLVGSMTAVDQSTFPNDEERHHAILEARKLLSRLENPWDTLLHLHFSLPAVTLSLKTCIDLGVFQQLDSGPKTSHEIAQAVGADEQVVNRMLRHLAAEFLIKETGPSTYGPTKFTGEMANGLGASGVEFMFDFALQAVYSMPEYLQKTSYKLPTDATDGNFQYGMKTSLPMFGPTGWMAQNPVAAKHFSELMMGYTSQRQNWVEVFPTDTLLNDNATPDDIVIVDVGGNAGEDTAHMMRKHPETANRLIVQDIEPVIAAATIPEGVKPMVHDFFTPQPVKHARAYFFHSIFHDWPDADCLRICENLKPAMGPNSLLLISDHVIRPTGAAAHQTGLDVLMMALLSSAERTEAQWYSLLERGGFKIKKIHPGRLESVIEAVPA